ncbi:MAG: CpaE family protein [Bdellovibrionales bacterium]
MNSDFMAFAHDEVSFATLKEWADRQGFPSDSVQHGDAISFGAMLDSDPAPKLVFVDFDSQKDPIQTAKRLVSLCGPTSKIIGIGLENDVSLYRSMLSTGMQDYLVKPLTQDNLTQAMVTAQGGGVKKKHKESKVIVFIGTRGGCGTSTLATNVACNIAHEKKEKTVLLDLDLQYGTSALSLDLDPGHGLRDLVSSAQRVDELMISGASIKESEMLTVLSAEESIEDFVSVDSYAVAALIKELRVNNQAIIVDLPRSLLANQKRVLATAHEIVLVTELSLVGIRDTLRVRNMMKALGSSAQITQVATRTEQNKGAIDEATFTKGANAKVHFMIPEDSKTLAAANNAGKPLHGVEPKAPITKAIMALTNHLVGSDEKSKNQDEKGFSLFGLLKG